MKKVRFCLILVCMLALLASPVRAEQPPELICGAVILVDSDHDEVLYEKNSRQRMYPASITKIMTSLLVLEAVDRGEFTLDTPVTATESAISAITDWDSATQNIKPGEILTINELLRCDLISSANEACNILAETVGGSLSNFVAKMNQRAQELGMENTHFVNPHGLHDAEHYTTAYDVYLMAKEAMKHEAFRTIVSTPSYVVPATNMSNERRLSSTNLLINDKKVPGYIYPKAIGIKTGSTSAAGQCLASAAVDSGGRTFYCVMLNSRTTTDESGRSTRHAFKDSAALLEWGFNQFKRVVLMDENSGLSEIQVTLSDERDHVLAKPQGVIERTMTADYDPNQAEFVTDLPESLEAPVTEGQKLGTITLKYQGEELGTLDMVAMESVARSDFQYYMKTAREYLETWWVRAILAGIVALALALMFIANVVIPRKRRRYGRSANRRNSYSGRRKRR